MNSRQLVGLKFIDGSGDEPASQPRLPYCLPGRPARLSLSRVLGAYAIELRRLLDSKGLVQLHQLLDD